MKTYKVTALKMGTLTTDKGSLTRQSGTGTLIDIPIWAAAVEGDSFRMVVDTGIANEKWVSENICPCIREADETMEGALEKIGWEAGKVQVVVNTHLHYDHCGNNRLFKNADFYAQRAEWEASKCPLPHQAVFYAGELFDVRAADGTRLHLIEGEYALADGIILIPTPGHSAGHQSVLVNTEEGVVCISGDAANVVENVSQNIVPDILTNSADAFTSLENIRRKAEFIIPGHEPAISKFASSGFPAIHDKRML